MKDGVERVWLPGDVRVWLADYRRHSGCSKSGFIRGCVFQMLGNVELDDFVKRLLLRKELEGLQRESRQLRRVQNSILADFVYLRDYARELVKGAFKNPAFVQLRRSILRYPNGEKALEALEHLFSRRLEIGARQCELVKLLYPENRYEEIEQLKTQYLNEPTYRHYSRFLAGDSKLVGGGNR